MSSFLVLIKLALRVIALALRFHTAIVADTGFLSDGGLSTEGPSLTLLSILLLFNLQFFLVHFFIKVLVMVITIEKFFEFLLVQQLHILLDLVTVVVLPLAVRVVRVEVVFVRWNERRGHPMVEQVVPLEVPQPRMILHILRTIQPQSI